jgi:hypothetical protein
MLWEEFHEGGEDGDEEQASDVAEAAAFPVGQEGTLLPAAVGQKASSWAKGVVPANRTNSPPPAPPAPPPLPLPPRLEPPLPHAAGAGTAALHVRGGRRWGSRERRRSCRMLHDSDGVPPPAGACAGAGAGAGLCAAGGSAARAPAAQRGEGGGGREGRFSAGMRVVADGRGGEGRRCDGAVSAAESSEQPLSVSQEWVRERFPERSAKGSASSNGLHGHFLPTLGIEPRAAHRKLSSE